MTGTEQPGTGEFSPQECVEALRAGTVARLGVIIGGRPLVLPFTYQVADQGELRAFVRITSAGEMSRFRGAVCLELDSIEESDGVAWSLVAHGELRMPTVGERAILQGARPEGSADEWRAIDITAVTGRRFVAVPAGPLPGFSVEWQFG